jgi:tetratricopeptide (TPR) repeat protein
LTIPDVGAGQEVKGGFGRGEFPNRFRGVPEEEGGESPQAKGDSGGGDLMADARAQTGAPALQQYAIPEVMREAADRDADKFSELSRGASRKAGVGDRDGALAEAEAMIKLQPWNPEAHLYKANLLNQARRFAEAEEAAREAVRLDPKNAEAWKTLGWAQLHQRKFAEAEKGLTQAIQLLEARRAAGEDSEELRNSLASAYAMRSFAYEGLGRRDKMIADLEVAARLAPGRFTGHLERARAGKNLFDPDAEDSWTLLDSLPSDASGPAPFPWPWLLVGLGVGTGGLFFTQRRRLGALFLSKDARKKREMAELLGGEAAGPLKDGDVLAGKYRLTAFLGSDADGERWEAFDASLNRTVALRRLASETFLDREARERLRAQGRTAAALQHPNIVAVFEALDLPNGVFLVMEHAPGRTVEQVLTAEGPVSPGRARATLEAAAAALAYARTQGVPHRGLKTSSLVVTDGGVVKVRDFAAAGAAGGDDLRALGACLYEMLTGRPLDFGAGRLQQGIVWPTQCRPGLPPAADQLVAAAVNPDPAQRFRSAADFVAALASLGPPEA